MSRFVLSSLLRRTQAGSLIASPASKYTMSVPEKRIELFYDVISPFTWFAFEVLMRYKKHWTNVKIELKPFNLWGIGKLAGNTTPILNPKKFAYIKEDMPRLARYFNVPMRGVSDPFKLILEKGSYYPCRFLIAIDMLYPEQLEDVTRALWMELWNKDEDFNDPVVMARAGQTGGLTEEQLKKVQKLMYEPVTKEKLNANVNLAFEYGGFGSPIIVAHVGEKRMLFFGSDRFPVLANEIGEKWLGPDPDAAKTKL